MKKNLFLFLSILTLTNCSSDDDSLPIKEVATFPRYGNYCGLDRPQVGEAPIPVDEVDGACMNHDRCYADKGPENVTMCDTMLITELKNITPKTEPEKVARKSIISYFRNSPQKTLMEINLDEIK